MKTGRNTVFCATMLLAAMAIASDAAVERSSGRCPSFHSPGDTIRMGARIKALADVAGADWREIAERNRTTGLHELDGRQLKSAVQKKAAAFTGTGALDTGKVPLAELGEITEAAFRGGFETDAYGWALVRGLALSDGKVSDPVTAAKLLAGIDCGLAGVVPCGWNGETVAYAPRWILSSFQTGDYKTTLPGGGYFESSWSNSMGSCSYVVRTSAKRLDCCIRLPYALNVYNVAVNGEDVASTTADFTSSFTAVPDRDGVARIDIYYIWAGGPKKVAKKDVGQPECVVLSFDGDGGEPSPLKAEKVAIVKGLSGGAAHFGRDSVLEYKADMPGFLTPTSGTFRTWIRQDDTMAGCNNWRDRDRDENGDVSWFIHSGVGQRTLFSSGSSFIRAGLLLRGKMGSVPGIENYWHRRVLGGEWHFVALSYDAASGTTVWFVDGEVMRSNTAVRVDVPLGGTFTLGSGGGRLGIEGCLDEVRFSPKATDVAELRREYLKWQPIRYELHDWSVAEGETKAFRFRARNESGEKIEKTLKFSNGATVALSLAPGELKEFAIDVKGGKPGLFTLWLNAGEADARQFECMCLGGAARPRAVAEDGDKRNASGKMTLLGEYDCTKAYPADRVALCASAVVTNGGLTYLESRDYRMAVPLSAYRFAIKNQGKPHLVELDYPDDRVRTFLFGVYPEKWARLYTKTMDCAGVMTGGEYPLSNRMQTKRLLFWPDSETVSVVVQNYTNKGAFRMPPTAEGFHGDYPAACAAVRLYELDALPPGPVQGMSPKTRSVAEWDEDPTIDADLTFSQSFNYDRADLEFWRVKWQRVIDYMRWNSMDSWVIKVVNYGGDVTAMDATLPEATLGWQGMGYSNGRCRGWAELGADMLSREGLGFWVRINHRDIAGWFSRLGGGDPDAPGKTMDMRNPAVRKAYLRLVAAYRDKFGRYPGFRGVTMNEYLQVFYPGGCAEMVEFAKELGSTIRAKGGDAEVQIWLSARVYEKAKVPDWDAERVFREAGVDVAALSRIPGIRVVPCVRPDYCWTHKRVSDEPYLPDSPSWARLMRDGGIDCVNVSRHSNLEIYPNMGNWEGGANPWKTDFWLPTFNTVTGARDFQSYSTPHARPPYTLDSVASLFADCDVQDFQTGWWGIMECGEHDEWRRFFGQFRQIPRGPYVLAKGPDDPVAVRSGAEGHYLVNREPYSVVVDYVVDGRREEVELAQHEIRFVPGRGANGAVEVKGFRIPPEEKAVHLANLEKLESAARADANNAVLSVAAKEARAALDQGRYHQFRALFRLGEVRRALYPRRFSNR